MSTRVSANDEGAATLGERIRFLRGERTQEEFAQLAGITRAALANYETGRTRPKQSLLREMSRRLGISEDFLLEGRVRNEYELNHIYGGPTDWQTYESEDELSILRILRVCRPLVVLEVVNALLNELEEQPDARAKADPLRIVEDITRLAKIARAEGRYEKGMVSEEADKALRGFLRRVRNQPKE